VDTKLQRWVQRKGWDRAAPYYERYWGEQLRPAIDHVLATADLRPGEHVLDVAAGTGAITLAAAAAVGPTGRVLATDLSPKMVDDLGGRAAARRCSNIDVACCGAEDLAPDEPFDVAVCSLGLMYVTSPSAVASNLYRSLRPGGRTVVSVWGDRRRCGWSTIFPIVDARVSSDVCPMFFALGTPGALGGLLERAGFVDVAETRLAVDLCYGSAGEALGAAFLGGPVALAASRFSEDERASADTEYLASIERFAEGTGYRIPGEFVVGSARRPLPNQHTSPDRSST